MSCIKWVPDRIVSLLAAVVVSGFTCASASAAFTELVVEETLDSRADTTGIGVEGGATLNLVDQGGGDQALQFTSSSAAGGFFAAGFTLGTLELEPGPSGPNASPNLGDYQLSFDLTVNAVDGFIPNLEIWLADGPRFSTNNANLYTASGLTDGTQSISFTLDQNLTTTTPNGFTSGDGPWLPTADDWWIQVNTISFGAPAGAAVDYTIDNLVVSTVPEPKAFIMMGLAVLGGVCLRRRSAHPPLMC